MDFVKPQKVVEEFQKKKTKITVKMPNIKGFGGDTGPFHMRLSSKEI